ARVKPLTRLAGACNLRRPGPPRPEANEKDAATAGFLSRKAHMKLKGRMALVTGASRGIGRAIAEVLASEGAAVAVNYRSGKEKAEEVVKGITSKGGKAVALPGDVADYAQAKTLVEQTVKELGGLHILINNAGIAKDGLIFNLEPEDWLAVMRVNFGGVFNCTKAAMGHFMAQRDGVIVNVSSV